MYQRGWIRRAFRLFRWSRGLGYLAIALAGAIALASPPVSIETATGTGKVLQLSWAAMMSISSGFCAWGALRERWVGEYIGLIPLGAVAAIFGISALSRGSAGWAGGFFLIGFFWILVSRWQEVALLHSEADRLTKGEQNITDERG